ncbi:hypothetical protein [Luteolibacter soli]
MVIGRVLACALMLAGIPGVDAEGEGDPFAEAGAKEEVRPVRVIAKLPGAVTHRAIAEGKHEYGIAGIYAASVRNGMAEKVEGMYEVLIPDAVEMRVDFKERRATFVTSRELSLSELAYAVDDMAKMGGDIPYWAELEARDLKGSEDFKQLTYVVEATSGEAPAGLAWFAVPRDEEFRMPLGFGGPSVGSVVVTPATAYCMCHSQFHLRILDPKGKVIWEDEGTAYGSVRIALAEEKDPEAAAPLHEIRLVRDDHGETKSFVIRGKWGK